jgi:hypothetical protein
VRGLADTDTGIHRHYICVLRRRLYVLSRPVTQTQAFDTDTDTHTDTHTLTQTQTHRVFLTNFASHLGKGTHKCQKRPIQEQKTPINLR